MIEQLSNQAAGVEALKGQKGEAVKGGLFSKFLAAFQKQLQKGAETLPTATQPAVQLSNRNISIAKVVGVNEAIANANAGEGSVEVAESGEVMKDAFFASLKGEKGFSTLGGSQINPGKDNELTDVVAVPVQVKAEAVNLFSKKEASGERVGSGEKGQDNNNLFTESRKITLQNPLSISENGVVTTSEKVVDSKVADPLTNIFERQSEKQAPLSVEREKAPVVLSNTGREPVVTTSEKVVDSKVAPLPTNMFESQSEKQAPLSVEREKAPVVLSNTGREPVVTTSEKVVDSKVAPLPTNMFESQSEKQAPLSVEREKAPVVLSNTGREPVVTTSEKVVDSKVAPLSTNMFENQPQKQALLSVEGVKFTVKTDGVENVPLRAEMAVTKDVKLPYQPGITPAPGVQPPLVAEDALADAPRVAEQKLQSGFQRGELQSAEGRKATLESMKKPGDQSDVPFNLMVQNSKARTSVQMQQLQSAQVIAGGERMPSQGGEQSQSGFQQDRGSSSQPEIALADYSKAELKSARGSDFAAQLNYRAAQSYKPADVMLEIARSAKDGSMKLELQLDPANLGKIQVSLQSDAAKQLQIHIVVEQSLSRQVIEQNLPQLRAALAEQGLDLGQFSMNMSSQGDGDNSSESARSAFSEFNTFKSVPGEQQGEPSTRLGINSASDGRLSILA